MAILFRTNEQPRAFEIELRQAKLPYVLVGGMSFYDRKEVRDILAYLKLLVKEPDEVSLLRVINVPPRGVGQASAAALMERAVEQRAPLWQVLKGVAPGDAQLAPTAVEGVSKLVGLVERFQRSAERESLVEMAKALVEEIRYADELARLYKEPAEQQARWQAVEEVINALGIYQQRSKRPTLAGFLDDVALGGRDNDQDKESQLARNAIALMTLHSAKGLEFPHVYLVGLEEGLLPHQRSVDADGPAIDEERRLCYVGVTRAQDRLTLSLALARMKWGKPRPTMPSRFLFEISGDAEKAAAISRGNLRPHELHAPSRPTKAKRPAKKAPRPAPAKPAAGPPRALASVPGRSKADIPHFRQAAPSAIAWPCLSNPDSPIFLSSVNCPVAGRCARSPAGMHLVVTRRAQPLPRGALPRGGAMMAHTNLRFIHTSDFHLERPLRGADDLPDALAQLAVEAPLRAAERVFEAAVREQVDFVLLAGDLLRPMAAGPRALVFLVEQFERLNERDVPVYWATGRADAATRWTEVLHLPPNVHVFSGPQVRRAAFERDGRLRADILGAGAHVDGLVRPGEFRAAHGHLTVALTYGRLETPASTASGVHYWALGGEHRRRVRSTHLPVVHYPGSPQGRTPREHGPHGATLVQVDEHHQIRTRQIVCDAVRWHDEHIQLDATATAGSLERQIESRARALVTTAPDRQWIVRWKVQAPPRLAAELRRGKLAADLLARLAIT